MNTATIYPARQRHLAQGIATPGEHLYTTVPETAKRNTYIKPSRPATTPTQVYRVVTVTICEDGTMLLHQTAFRQKRHAEMWLEELM